MIQNPILRGFCPDPSIIRVGEDYYIATSTFEWWPGVRLFHSRDLKSWEQIPSPLQRKSQLDMVGNPPSGGIWAPCLSYDGERFFLVYTDVKTKKGKYYNTHNYVVWAEDIYGPWSEPVYLNSIGFDPSLFHDVDGKKYLVNMLFKFKGILVQEVDPVTFAPIGEQRKVYQGSGLRCTEGPHMYHIGDWYYVIVAEGGTGYGHCVTMARAKTVWGPFETAPDNPILTSDQEDPEALQKCGHGDIVETQDGEWYMVHLCSRPVGGQKWSLLGRETAIQKMVWDEDGWLRLAGGGRYARSEVEEPGFLGKLKETEKNGMSENGRDTASPQDTGAGDRERAYIYRDDFNEDHLATCYSSPRCSYNEFADLSVNKGFLRLRGQEYMNSNHHVSLVAVRQQEACCSAETCVSFEPVSFLQMAGLAYMYDSLNFFLLGKTAMEDGQPALTLLRCDRGEETEETEPIILPEGEEVSLKVVVEQDGTVAKFFYHIPGGDWTQVGGEYSTEILTDEYCRGFTGAHFGMYVHDMVRMEKCADFRYFKVEWQA